MEKDGEPKPHDHTTRRNFLPPGGTIGLLGGGQLGRMFALEARKLGWRIVVLDPEPGCPAAAVCDEAIAAAWTDKEAVRRFAGCVDVVTYEFENIPVETLEQVERVAPVYPPPRALHICQNREREKLFLREHGIPCAPFWIVDSAESLDSALQELGGAGVLKTASFGYDGRGQLRVKTGDDAAEIWSRFGADRAVLEGWVDFTDELSVVCARGLAGSITTFPVAENRHTNHILDFTIVPARIPAAAQQEAERIARRITETLGIVGLLATEFFLCRDGRVIVNELAPRPHNSGHFSLDACVTSQFEQQARAICGAPLGSTELLRPVAMWNLLGDLWHDGEPDWCAVLSRPDAKLHLYGKTEARRGRKMGHVCVLGETADAALAGAESIRATLTRS
jgi:phosphoribosylaminoimidazole carboxylase, PurK protein